MAIATTAMAAPKTILIVDCNAACDGSTPMTDAIQKAINMAAPKGGTVTFKPGTYLTGALFLKSGVTFEIPKASPSPDRRTSRTSPICPPASPASSSPGPPR